MASGSSPERILCSIRSVRSLSSAKMLYSFVRVTPWRSKERAGGGNAEGDRQCLALCVFL